MQDFLVINGKFWPRFGGGSKNLFGRLGWGCQNFCARLSGGGSKNLFARLGGGGLLQLNHINNNSSTIEI